MKRHPRFTSFLVTTLLVSGAAVACNQSDKSVAPTESAPSAGLFGASAAAAPEMARTEQGLVADGRYRQAGMADDKAGEAQTRGQAGQAGQTDARRAADGRKIIRTGQLEVHVDDYEPTRKEIDALLKASGGFIASAQVGHSDGRVTEANLVLRVPTQGYEDLVARLSALGTVVAESSNAEDVTDQWVDVTARLANAKKLEGRLIELVATQAGNVTQLLEVERELARVREQIELFEGRLHVLDDQVSLSTLTLRVQARVPYQAATLPSLADDAGRTLSASWGEVSDLSRSAAIGLIGFLPWLPLVALGAWLARRYGKRAYRRVLAAAPPRTTT